MKENKTYQLDPVKVVEYLEDFKEGINKKIDAIIESQNLVIELIINKKQSATAKTKKGGYITKTMRQKILQRDDWTCKNCGWKLPITSLGSEMHIDHILPRSKGGKTEENNLQCLCKTCNLQKKAYIFDDLKNTNEGGST